MESILARELTMISNSFILFVCSTLFHVEVRSFITEQNELRIIAVLLTKVTYFFLGRIIIGFFSKKTELLAWQWAVTGASFLLSTLAGTLAIRLARNMPEKDATDRIELLVIVCCIWICGIRSKSRVSQRLYGAVY